MYTYYTYIIYIYISYHQIKMKWCMRALRTLSIVKRTQRRVRSLLSLSLISCSSNRTCSISTRTRYALPAFSLLFSFRTPRNRSHRGQYQILPETVYRDNSNFLSLLLFSSIRFAFLLFLCRPFSIFFLLLL